MDIYVVGLYVDGNIYIEVQAGNEQEAKEKALAMVAEDDYVEVYGVIKKGGQ